MRTKPNVLWIMTDEHRTDAIGAYGGQPNVRTPALDALASRGVLFENAFCQSPICMPSRASFMTGRYCHSAGVLNNDVAVRIPDDVSLVGSLFREAGYHTENIGKMHMGRRPGDGDETGFDEHCRPRGAVRMNPLGYEGEEETSLPLFKSADPVPLVLSGVHPAGPDETDSAAITRRAIRFLQERGDREEPFFLRVSYEQPHTPVLPPVPYDTAYAPSDLRIPEVDEADMAQLPSVVQQYRTEYRRWDLLRPFERARACTAYYGLASYVDACIGDVLRALEETDAGKNTVVVFCADHGVLLGEHGLYNHNPHHYDEETRVPLILSRPGTLPCGERFSGLVELVDIAPTLLELCGLPVPDAVEGESLVPRATGEEKAGKSAVFSEGGGANLVFLDNRPSRLDAMPPRLAGKGWEDRRRVCVRTDEWKMVVYNWDLRDEERQLFHLASDPRESTNHAGRPEYREVEALLAEHIRRFHSEIRWHASAADAFLRYDDVVPAPSLSPDAAPSE